jgi:disulfide bond formation protein DsbB
LIGQGIATYHYLLEKTNIFAAPTACQEGIPCTTPWINWWGFVTIPFLAMCAFFLITVLSLIALTAGEPEPEEFSSAPWFQVGTVIVLVVALFMLLYRFDPVRAESLTLTVPVTGEMTSVNATAAPTVQLSQVNSGTTTSETGAGSEIIALGGELYQANCSVCHGGDAQGMPNLGTSLVESAIIDHEGDANALAFIREGRPASHPDNTTGVPMPPSGAHPELTDEEILAIIAFLRSQ